MYSLHCQHTLVLKNCFNNRQFLYIWFNMIATASLHFRLAWSFIMFKMSVQFRFSKTKTVSHDFRSSSLYTRFDVVAGKESSVTVHNTFPPAIIILLDDVDNCSFVKREFVVLVLLVAVDSDHCNTARQISTSARHISTSILEAFST